MDNYNRQIFTQPRQNKTASATLEEFHVIIRANGKVLHKEITVDLGNEYALLEAEIVGRAAYYVGKTCLQQIHLQLWIG